MYKTIDIVFWGIPTLSFIFLLPTFPHSLSTESSDFSGDGTSSQVTIPASPSSTVSLVVSLLDDEVVEMSQEFFSVSISSSQTGVTVTDNDTATIFILDNDSQ